MVWVNALLQGLLVGGLYALLAAGLSLVFGVMKIVNLSHGDFSIVTAFFVITLTFQMNIGFAILIVLPLMALIGYLVQRLIINKVILKGELAPLLVTFALSIIFQNLLLQVYSADNRSIQIGSLNSASLKLTNELRIGLLPFLTFLMGIFVTLSLHFLLTKTQIGRAIRSSSDDPGAADLVGINNRHIYAVTTALGILSAAIAGVLFGMRTQFSPSFGPVALIFAFEAVIIGGLGSLWGTLVGGVVLGLAQAIGSQIAPSYGVMAGHIAFVLILIIKPEGLLSGRKIKAGKR